MLEPREDRQVEDDVAGSEVDHGARVVRAGDDRLARISAAIDPHDIGDGDRVAACGRQCETIVVERPECGPTGIGGGDFAVTDDEQVAWTGSGLRCRGWRRVSIWCWCCEVLGWESFGVV